MQECVAESLANGSVQAGVSNIPDCQRMNRKPKLPPRMPPRDYVFGDVVSKMMKTHDPPLNNSQLADRAGININTVGDLLNGRFQPSLDTQNKVAAALDTTREDIMAEVQRLNAAPNVVPIRSGRGDREEDKDPELREALDLGRRIRKLDAIKRMSIAHLISGFEQDAERIKRLEELLAHRDDRNNHRKQ